MQFFRLMTWREWLAIAGAVFALLAFHMVAGCSHNVTHEIAIKIDLDDECLTAFPVCNAAGDFLCVDNTGSVQAGCNVTCVASRELTCEPDGPHCFQVFGDDKEDFPVFCRGNL